MTPPALLEKTIRRVAMGVALLVALSIPAAFVFLDHQDLTESLAFRTMLLSSVLGLVLGAIVYFAMNWLPLRALRAATQEMQAALEAAERANAAKRLFLANMSHEIRTPIGAVMGLARIGMRQNIGRKTEKTCAQILDAGRHLLGVVSDILDFSRIEAGKLVIDPRSFRLAAMVQQTVDMVADRALAKDLQLTVEYIAVPPAPTFVVGDALRLGQILMNLLGNAIKFTESGVVRLSIDRQGDQILFRVADSGPGISPEQMSCLFKPFEQADNTLTRKHGGAGLGLAISRDLARLMGGDIEVSSTVGQGSVFTLHLPLPPGEPVVEVETAPHAAEGPLLIGLCVLAAEDVEVNRVILEDMITTQGATVVWAHDGQQAVDLVASRGAAAFDIVLMDVQMPVMNGYEATTQIRALAPQLPVIGVTAHAMAEERERCLAAGMVAHLTKPIDPDVLVATILEHVATRPPLPLPAAVAEAAPMISATPPVMFAEGGALIDQRKLLARYQYRQSFIDKLLATVISSHTGSPAKLRAAAAAGDTETIRFMAHALKGIGGSIEAASLVEQARVTEDCAKSGADEAGQQALKLATITEDVLRQLAVAVA